MKKTPTALLLALTLSGCLATTGDLRDLADQVDAYNAGAITEDELATAIDQKADEIEARAEDLANSLPTSPAGWIALLAQMGAAAAAGGVGVNKYRNSARRKRGERVSTEPPAGS